jgi:hypothetical protein
MSSVSAAAEVAENADETQSSDDKSEESNHQVKSWGREGWLRVHGRWVLASTTANYGKWIIETGQVVLGAIMN